MALKIVEIPYGVDAKGEKVVRFFTGFIGQTDWPEYLRDRSRARILSSSAANDAVSRIRGRTGMKARAVVWTPSEETASGTT